MNESWTDAEMLTALHMLAEGKTAVQVGRALGRPRNAVLGIKHRVKLAYDASCAGDPDPDRHDATMGWAWVEMGIERQEIAA